MGTWALSQTVLQTALSSEKSQKRRRIFDDFPDQGFFFYGRKKARFSPFWALFVRIDKLINFACRNPNMRWSNVVDEAEVAAEKGIRNLQRWADLFERKIKKNRGDFNFARKRNRPRFWTKRVVEGEID